MTRLILLSLFATLPTSLLSEWMGWDFMEPKGYFAEIAWMPVMMWCQLKALAAFQNKEREVDAGMVLRAFSAEALLSLRMAPVAIAGCLPALYFSSVFGWDAAWKVAVSLLLGLAGALPPLIYTLRRLFILPVILWQGLGATEARYESARLSQGKLLGVLLILLSTQLGSFLLQMGGEISVWAGLAALPASFLCGNWGLARSYKKLL